MSSLTVRKLEIDLSDGFGRHWLGGDAYRTQLFNALSMTFPVGEQMFIDSVRAVPPEQLADPGLRADVKDFIGQEASHRFVHIQYNAQLARQGLDFTLGPSILRRVEHIYKLPLHARLAITCALEHYTAILADGALLHPEWLGDAEPAMRTLWSWHAVEETEHKAVAFDAYLAAGGKYWPRVLWYLQVSSIFWTDTFRQTVHNLRNDGQLYKAGTWISAARTWFGRRGMAWHILPQALRYLSPSFHPWQHDNRRLVSMWLDGNSSAFRAVNSTPS
ncbi:MAG: metal-dependent hydrolase [Massilia sp.]